jgi:hypothetical protein
MTSQMRSARHRASRLAFRLSGTRRGRYELADLRLAHERRKLHMASQSPFSLIPKPAALWIALLVLLLIERTLSGARTCYGLFIGLGLVFVFYGLTICSIFVFLHHTSPEPFYVLIMFLLWSLFICCVLAGFAVAYDVLPHTPEPSLGQSRPLID